MRRCLILMVLVAMGLIVFNRAEYSTAQDEGGGRLLVEDYAPISPENVLYLEAISELDPEVDEPILSVEFGPENGSFMATTEHGVTFWSVEGALNGEAPLERVEVGADEWLETEFSDNSGLVVIGTGSGIEIWDTVRLERIGGFEGERERGQVMAFSGDGEVFAYQLGENLRYWDTVEGVELASRLLTEPIVEATFSPDGQYIAFKLEDSAVRVEFLDFPDIDRVATIEHGMIEEITPLQMAFSPYGRWLFMYGESTTIQAWDTETWTLDQNIELFQYVWRIEYLDFSPDGNIMVAGGWNTLFHRWMLNEETGEIVALPRETTGGVITNVGFTSESTLLSAAWSIGAGTSEEAVYILDPKSGRSYVAQSEVPTWMDRSVQFSWDNRLLAFPLGEHIEEFTYEFRTIGFYGVPNAVLDATPFIPIFEVPELPVTERERITPNTVSRLEMTELDAGESFSDVDHMEYFSVRNVAVSPNSEEMSWTYHLRPSEPGTGEEQVFLFRWNFVDAPSYGPFLSDCECYRHTFGYDSNGRLVAYVTFSETEETAIIDAETGEVLETLTIDPAGIWQVSPNGEFVAIGKRIDETLLYQITLWNPRTGEHFELGTTMYGVGVFRPDSQVYFGDGQAWDTSTGELVFEYALEFVYPDPMAVVSTGLVEYGWGNSFILGDGRIITVSGAYINPDQSILALGFPRRVSGAQARDRLELIDMGSFDNLVSLEIGGGAVLFTRDGTRLVNAGQDDVIRVGGVHD